MLPALRRLLFWRTTTGPTLFQEVGSSPSAFLVLVSSIDASSNLALYLPIHRCMPADSMSIGASCSSAMGPASSNS